MPTALSRLWRNRTALVAIALIGSLASAASALGDVAVVRIAAGVDAHWRGAYDILVRPANSRQDLERTGGLVEPNFLGFGGKGGISLASLDAIRQLAGVELAAPVGFVGFATADASAPLVSLPSPPGKPTLYRLTIVLMASDGVTDHVVTQETNRLLYGPDPETIATDFAGRFFDGRLVANHSLPALRSPILAVDPAAERELLGPSSEFLDPLLTVAGVERTVRTFGHQRIPDAYLPAQKMLRFAELVEPDPGTNAQQVESIHGRPVVPLLVSSSVYSDLRLTLEVVQIGNPLDTYPDGSNSLEQLAAAERSAGIGEKTLGTSELHVGPLLRPLQLTEVSLVWPGHATPPVDGHGFVTSAQEHYLARLVERPDYDPAERRHDPGALSFLITPRGAVEPEINGRPAPGSEFDVGAEPVYRDYEDLPFALAADFVSQGPDDRPFFLAPLGEFDLATLELPDDPLSYVPMGAYDPPDTMLVAGPNGAPRSSPVPVLPRLDPAGLLALPPLAITDMTAAQLLRGPTPIDAIRVRVAGITDFGPAAQAKIRDVADAIAAMGFDTDIVAGSSPQTVEIYVPEYFVDEAPPGDLGWVQQGWTTLGAAERVERGLSGATTALLGLAVFTAVVAAAGFQFFGISARRREVAVLRASGWGQRQTTAWLLGEATVGALIVTALALAGWALGGRSTSAAVAGGLIALAYLVAALGAAAAAYRGAAASQIGSIRAGDIWGSVPRVGAWTVAGPFSYGIRNLFARPARLLALITGICVTATAVAVGAMRVAMIVADVGPTRLAAALASEAEPLQLVIVAIIALVGLGFTLATWRVDAVDRMAETKSLRSAGWEERDLRRAHLAGAVVGGVLAAGPAALLALVVASQITTAPVFPTLALAAAVAVAIGSAGALTARSPRHAHGR